MNETRLEVYFPVNSAFEEDKIKFQNCAQDFNTGKWALCYINQVLIMTFAKSFEQIRTNTPS